MAIVKEPRNLTLTETERTFRVDLYAPEGADRYFDIHREVLLRDGDGVLHARNVRMLRASFDTVKGIDWQVPDGPKLTAQQVADFLEFMFDAIATDRAIKP